MSSLAQAPGVQPGTGPAMARVTESKTGSSNTTVRDMASSLALPVASGGGAAQDLPLRPAAAPTYNHRSWHPGCSS